MIYVIMLNGDEYFDMLIDVNTAEYVINNFFN